MIIQHLKDFFKNSTNLFTAGSLIAISSLATIGISNVLTKKECKVEKPGYIYFKDSESVFKKKWIDSFSQNEIKLKELSTQESQTISFDNIRKLIIFFDENTLKEEETKPNIQNFSYAGNYKIFTGGYEGLLSIYYTKSGSLEGYLQFPKWGKGKIELLKFIQIKNNQITFIRSCEGKECIEIGSPYNFKQTYIGSFNEKGELEGKYFGTHSSGQWKAIRVQN